MFKISRDIHLLDSDGFKSNKKIRLMIRSKKRMRIGKSKLKYRNKEKETFLCFALSSLVTLALPFMMEGSRRTRETNPSEKVSRRN